MRKIIYVPWLGKAKDSGFFEECNEIRFFKELAEVAVVGRQDIYMV
jgi:hypothetical protein